MEQSGENWPSHPVLEIYDEVIFEDGESESMCDDDEDHYCEEIGDPTDRKGRNEREITKRMMELSSAIGLKKEICDELIFEDGEPESVYEEIGNPTDRKGRNEREIKERMMELSSAIGLKKMDDTLILDKARDYVEKLQDRVKELEQEVGANVCSNKRTKLNSNDYKCGTSNDDILLEVKAKVLQKEVLIIIHCEKQNGVVLKILDHLESLHLSVVSSSVLRFGKSIFDITIIAQMGDGYNITVDELVKTLKIVISTQ